MCGIAGIVEYSSNVDPGVLGKMIAAIRHRGPDDQGIWTDKEVGLGNCRLAILDLSHAGHMPMSDWEGQTWITHNGEIYNFLELREELATKGYQFRSNSDTEVILNSYKEWGMECLQRFNGMWAFVIWDGIKKTLFGARDRFGVKPLYFYHDEARFIFASEVKAICTVVQASLRPNEEMVYSFLADRVMDHLSPKTLYANISEVPPAHWFELRHGQLTSRRYWDIPEVPSEDRIPFNEKAIEDFNALMEDAVRVRLRADVQVGTLLSGGLDSSSVTCLAYNILGGNKKCESLHSFSALYDGAYDESRYVDAVTSGTNIEVHRAQPSANELFDALNIMIWHQEAPFADASFFAQYFLMKLACQNNTKVLLSGQGADEILAGYPTSMYAYCGGLLASGEWKKLVGILRGASNFPPTLINALKHSMPIRWKNYLRRRSQLHTLQWIDKDLVEKYSDCWFAKDSRMPLDRHLYQYITRYSLPTLLHHEDRNSMALSVETRQPFLDYRLVELAFKLADDAKINQGTTKTILRSSMRGIVPDKILSRHDKIGFHVPLDKFLMVSREFVMDFIGSPTVRANPYINIKRVVDMANLFYAGKYISVNNIWRPFIFVFWYASFIQKSSSIV